MLSADQRTKGLLPSANDFAEEMRLFREWFFRLLDAPEPTLLTHQYTPTKKPSFAFLQFCAREFVQCYGFCAYRAWDVIEAKTRWTENTLFVAVETHPKEAPVVERGAKYVKRAWELWPGIALDPTPSVGLIDCVARKLSRAPTGESKIRLPIFKADITHDGVCATIAALGAEGYDVMLRDGMLLVALPDRPAPVKEFLRDALMGLDEPVCMATALVASGELEHDKNAFSHFKQSVEAALVSDAVLAVNEFWVEVMFKKGSVAWSCISDFFRPLDLNVSEYKALEGRGPILGTVCICPMYIGTYFTPHRKLSDKFLRAIDARRKAAEALDVKARDEGIKAAMRYIAAQLPRVFTAETVEFVVIPADIYLSKWCEVAIKHRMEALGYDVEWVGRRIQVKRMAEKHLLKRAEVVDFVMGKEK